MIAKPGDDPGYIARELRAIEHARGRTDRHREPPPAPTHSLAAMTPSLLEPAAAREDETPRVSRLSLLGAYLARCARRCALLLGKHTRRN